MCHTNENKEVIPSKAKDSGKTKEEQVK